MNVQVQETNDFSIASKQSMVNANYFKDDTIQFLSPKLKKRSPLINICYFVRATVVNQGLTYFLTSTKDIDSQILSLGAGFDTTYFRLISEHKNVNYFEIDFRDVVNGKICQLKKSAFLWKKLVEPADCPHGLETRYYNLIAQDMNNLKELQEILFKSGFDTNKPTLLLSECALTYMEEDRSRDIIKWGASFPHVMFMIYEQVSPRDGFGQVMINHFNCMESPLKSIETYQTKKDQINRYKSCGYEEACSIGAFEMYKNILSLDEQKRVLKLEPFDEWEEWHLTSSHYTLSVGTKGIFNLPLSKCLSFGQEKSGMPLTEAPVEWNTLKNANLQFYGHSGILIWKSQVFLIVGGFGLDFDNRHKRLQQVRLVTLKDMSVKNVNPPEIKGVCWDCLHSSCSLLSDSENKTTFLLFGGRTSPMSSVNKSPFVITILRDGSGEANISAREIVTAHGLPEPRRRHSAVGVAGNTFIFGGVQTYYNQERRDIQVYGDFWKLNEEEEWSVLEAKPCPRFSQDAISDGAQIYISAGINDQFEVLSDIWAYNISQKVWTEIKVYITPRYGHTSHFINGNLFLLGGVNYLSEKQPGICLINPSTLSSVEYNLPKSNQELPIMLHNHCSFICTKENTFYIIGGGGTCFSFGTSFNKHPVLISIDALLVNK